MTVISIMHFAKCGAGGGGEGGGTFVQDAFFCHSNYVQSSKGWGTINKYHRLYDMIVYSVYFRGVDNRQRLRLT